MGGFIEREGNLSHYGKAWIDREAIVYDKAIVYDDAWVGGNAKVHGNAHVCGYSDVGSTQLFAYTFLCRGCATEYI